MAWHFRQVCDSPIGFDDNLKSRRVTPAAFCFLNLLAQLEQLVARLYGAGGSQLHSLEVIGVGNHGDAHGGVVGSSDLFQIHLQQQVALLDLVADLDDHLDLLAVHVAAGTDSQNLGDLRLFLGGAGQDQTALGGLFFFDQFDDNTVCKRFDFHKTKSSYI